MRLVLDDIEAGKEMERDWQEQEQELVVIEREADIWISIA